jgi:hypothetical protein
MDQLPRRSGKCELWEHDRPTGGLGESSFGDLHTYMFKPCSYVKHLIMGIYKSGSFDTEIYTSGDVYMESI